MLQQLQEEGGGGDGDERWSGRQRLHAPRHLISSYPFTTFLSHLQIRKPPSPSLGLSDVIRGEPKCWYGIPGSEAHAFEQEPGNFVVTFPRSFHGGFNFGLNCAEAVNFAPADWLPHGGYGAEMYKLYHKPAVLSHEELLCVVAKTVCDTKVLPYVKEEMHRIFIKEKVCREEIWRNGILKSSTFPPRKHPEYVGTEEDPTCIICQQYLYLSAIACSCRPSAFVCLEHWKHFCECNPSKHRLLYRHTLAELNDLAHMVSSLFSTTMNWEGMASDTHCGLHFSCSSEPNAMTKKVKGGNLTLTQLAEDWLLKASSIFRSQFSKTVFSNALKEAEQFLWADHEMDPVRDMACRLIEAQKWALNLRACILKVDSCLNSREKDIEKVSLSDVEGLLTVDPLPCNEPGYSKLKAYAEDAKLLILEIKCALSSSSHVMIGQLESLYSRASEFPIHLEESETLARKLYSAKVWLAGVRECLSKETPDSIEIDVLHKLKSEILELRVQFPELELLLDMLREADSWQFRCRDVLEGSLKLKGLENFLHIAVGVTVSIPELKLLRQYHHEACSWTDHLHDVLQSINKREDHGNIVEELNCILKAGALLKVQVDELPLVESELKKSRCREKAQKTLAIRMPLEFIKQLMIEAASLQIDNEKVFHEISEILSAAISWEERAKYALSCAAEMSEFEDIIRSSENILIALPSLADVKDAVSVSNSWMRRAQPFLTSEVCSAASLNSLLKVDDLKDLVAESKLLKVTLEGPERLLHLLKDVESWQRDASSLLDQSMSLLYGNYIDTRIDNELLITIAELLVRVDATTKVGLSLAFDFCEMEKLQHAHLTLQWCLKAVSFVSGVPLLEEVDNLMEDMQHLPAMFYGFSLGRTLIVGARWLKKALVAISEPCSSRRCKLEEAEEVLDEVQRIGPQFDVVVVQLQIAINRHKSWAKQVHAFFQSKSDEQHWLLLSKIKELGESDAFGSPELDMVVSEIEKVKKWVQLCIEIVKPSVGYLSSLTEVLVKIKASMDRALCIYCSSNGCKTRVFCACCSNNTETEEVFTCLTCMDRYHFSCVGPPFATAGMTNEYACPFCLCMESGTISRNGGRPLICRGKRPKLKSFIELLADAKDFYVGVEEKDLVQEIVKRALECKSYLTEIVNQTLAHVDKELNSVSDNLSNALKSTAVSGVYDDEGSCNLESALTRHSWKIRVKKLLKGSRKPVIQQILRILKEGIAINMPSEDHFMQELTQVKDISLQWVDLAKKVASDSGALELSEVFKLMNAGENLPVYFEKEMKLLRTRSVLYCICLKPYDQRAMIACDQCDEWYHFDCINLQEPPSKTFFCPACKPLDGELISLPSSLVHEERSITDGVPQTPPPRYNESKGPGTRKNRSSSQHKMQDPASLNDILRCYSKIDRLWRESRKPFRRTAKRRSQFHSLSLVLHSQH